MSSIVVVTNRLLLFFHRGWQYFADFKKEMVEVLSTWSDGCSGQLHSCESVPVHNSDKHTGKHLLSNYIQLMSNGGFAYLVVHFTF